MGVDGIYPLVIQHSYGNSPFYWEHWENSLYINGSFLVAMLNYQRVGFPAAELLYSLPLDDTLQSGYRVQP